MAALLPEVVSDEAALLVMQNGLGVEAGLHRAVPRATVLGAMCFMCCTKVGPGHIHHLDYGAVTLGEYREDGRPAGVTDAVQGAVDDLQTAGVSASPVADLETGRWQKLVWNIPFNGLSVVLDATTAELVADEASRRLAELIMLEVVNAARACGHGFDEAFVAQMLANTEQMAPYRPSMKLDHDAGRPLELDAIYAAPVAAANAAGAPMPRTEVLLAELRRIDRSQVSAQTS